MDSWIGTKLFVQFLTAITHLLFSGKLYKHGF